MPDASDIAISDPDEITAGLKSVGTFFSDSAQQLVKVARDNPKTAIAAGAAVVGVIAAAAIPAVRASKKPKTPRKPATPKQPAVAKRAAPKRQAPKTSS